MKNQYYSNEENRIYETCMIPIFTKWLKEKGIDKNELVHRFENVPQEELNVRFDIYEDYVVSFLSSEPIASINVIDLFHYSPDEFLIRTTVVMRIIFDTFYMEHDDDGRFNLEVVKALFQNCLNKHFDDLLLSNLKQIIVEQLGVNVSHVKLSANLYDDLGMDSLDLIEVVTVIEDEFDVEISDESVEKMILVQDIIDYCKIIIQRNL